MPDGPVVPVLVLVLVLVPVAPVALVVPVVPVLPVAPVVVPRSVRCEWRSLMRVPVADPLALVRGAGCEPAVVDWCATGGEIAAGLPGLRSPDWPRRRRAARELSDALATRFTLPGPVECEVSGHRVPTRAGEITVLRYRPPRVTGPRMAHLSIHGGGFVLGSVHEVVNARLARSRAVSGGADIFDVDYRLAPEHPFPAALEDCLDALTWLIESAPRFGIGPGRIGVGGVSAGGNLAGLVAAHARDRGIRLDHQVLEVPAASLDFDRDDSFRAYGALGGLGGGVAELHAAYLGGVGVVGSESGAGVAGVAGAAWAVGVAGSSRSAGAAKVAGAAGATGVARTPGPAEWSEVWETPGSAVRWAAPADVPDLTGLPPALVITAELDPLRDSGESYAARLARAGVPVESWRAPGQLHGSGSLTQTSTTARAWQDRVGAFLRGRARAAAVSPPT
ncbi:alpha/beta hydrolase [Streptomyces sp. NPDC059477]|uniref:alpha/beta hydrolase n=1 Tax=Streptomyces sp. NPDC059477 TaxID=3346847 RepID=UPI0036A2F660